MIYGSVAPRFCGVEAATVTTQLALERRGIDVKVVDVENWGMAKVSKLMRSVSGLRPDVIFMAYPTLAFDRNLGPVLFSLLQRIAPMIVVVHEFSHVHVLRRLTISALVTRAALVVVTTEAEKASLLKWNPWIRQRVVVNPIPSNIPPREWRPSPECEITMFSQFRPEKGLEQFLACCESLAKSRPDLKFRIIGSETPRFAEYAAQIRRRAAEHDVAISENLSNDAVADSLAQATVALLPFPDGATERRSSLMAALACGVPVVTTKGPNTPGNLALTMVPANDHAGLVQHTLDYCGDPEARSAAHRRSVKVAERFSTKNVIGKIVEYIEMLHRNQSGHSAGSTMTGQV